MKKFIIGISIIGLLITGIVVKNRKKEQKVITPIPSPKASIKPSPSLSPLPSLKPIYYSPKPKPVIDSNPLVNCNIHVNCGGGTKLLKQSECNKSICCGFNYSGWKIYPSSEECTKAQQEENRQNNTYNPSIYDYPTYSPIPLPRYEPYVYKPYVPSDEEIQADIDRENRKIEQRIKECKNEVMRITAQKIQGYWAKYGGTTGTAAALEKLAKEEMERALKKCEI